MLRISKSIRAPTAATTVCRAPVERCTEKPLSTRCSTTCWICSSVADSCIATIIEIGLSLVASLGCANDQRLTTSDCSVVHLRIQFRFTGRLCCLGRDLFLLDLAHDVHNAFVNAKQ